MRLTNVARGSRTPQNELRVPFQEILPLKLKNTVSGKGEKTGGVSCLQEMAVMFACLKQHEFNETGCSQQVQNFQKCWKNHLENQKSMAEQDGQGPVTTGSRNLGHRAINRILKRFPVK